MLHLTVIVVQGALCGSRFELTFQEGILFSLTWEKGPRQFPLHPFSDTGKGIVLPQGRRSVGVSVLPQGVAVKWRPPAP